MCGIYGMTLLHPDERKHLDLMGKLLIHRGPDGEGSYSDERVAMGMRRLSIIDVEHGNQPFFNRTKTVVVMCNGEIYNYRELRGELEGKGYQFSTGSDIEVLPHLYDEYGMDFLQKLNGMYAIALYDRTSRKVILVRDRLGIKPLYFSTQGGRLIYASEMKSILATGIVRKEIDYSAFSTYLDLMYIPRPMTPVKGVSKLDSGAYLVWEDGKSSIRKYWEPVVAPDFSTSEESWLKQIGAVLESSIELELRSDVPLGSFLSGGVDSSIVTALAAKASPMQFTSFHMHWKDVEGKLDESGYAQMVSQRYRTRHLSSDIGEVDLIGILPKLIWHMDEPFADAAFVPTYILSGIAAQEVKVVLSGAGGDELFGGYGHHRNQPLAVSVLKRILLGKDPRNSYYDIWKTSHARRWSGLFPWFVPDYRKEAIDGKYREHRKQDEVGAILLSDTTHYLQDDILQLTDKMTMAASIECRVPLLDHRLVELCLRIPSRLKADKDERKRILKKFCERHLPSEVIYRQKEGFGSPVWLWVAKYKELYFDILLENGFLLRNGLIAKKPLYGMIASATLGRRSCWMYWQIVVLEIWCTLYLDGISHEHVFEID